MNNTTFWVSKLNVKMSIKITLNTQGGISSKYTIAGVIGNKIGELPVPTYGDKYFDGWFTSTIGGDKITKDTIVTEAHRTIFAHWIDPVEIEWDATTNGGTLVPHSYKYYPTQPFGNLPEANGPSDKPYLNGWWTTADESGEYITKSSIVGDVRKYYAHYDDYNDPFGKYICPTKNLWFTTQDSGIIALEDRADHWYSVITKDCVYFTCKDSQQATLKSTLIGPGVLTYATRGSTEGAWDGLVFFMDEYYNSSIFVHSYDYASGNRNNPPYIYANGTYGETGWQSPEVTLNIPSGEHEIYWVYTRDGSESGGENKVWVANIRWNPS